LEKRRIHEAEIDRQNLVIEESNKPREQQRMDWVESNKGIKLYFNTICGITVVLNEADRAYIMKMTSDARMNELWTSDSYILSEKSAILYAKSGADMLQTNIPSAKCEFDGWFSNLHNLRNEYSCELVHDPRIFVPFVNEGILKFQEQLAIINIPKRQKLSLFDRLLGSLAPAELQNIPLLSKN